MLRAQQMECLGNLHHMALLYAASRMSLPYDRALDGVRGITMASILAVFFAVMKNAATDGVGMASNLLRGVGPDGQPTEAGPLKVNVKGFDGKSFEAITERLPLTSSSFVEARHRAVQYFEGLEGEKELFSWAWEVAPKGGPMMAMFGQQDNPTYKVEIKDDATSGFIGQVLGGHSVLNLPNAMDIHEPPVETLADAKLLGNWYCDEHWSFCPEVGMTLPLRPRLRQS